MIKNEHGFFVICYYFDDKQQHFCNVTHVNDNDAGCDDYEHGNNNTLASFE